jgi:hypothetical protein
MVPMAKVIVSTVRRKARATSGNPMPKPGNPVARTALPQPSKTNQNVPTNSAVERFQMGMDQSSYSIN